MTQIRFVLFSVFFFMGSIDVAYSADQYTERVNNAWEQFKHYCGLFFDDPPVVVERAKGDLSAGGTDLVSSKDDRYIQGVIRTPRWKKYKGYPYSFSWAKHEKVDVLHCSTQVIGLLQVKGAVETNQIIDGLLKKLDEVDVVGGRLNSSEIPYFSYSIIGLWMQSKANAHIIVTEEFLDFRAELVTGEPK